MNKLIVTTNERGFNLLNSLLGDTAEVLMGDYDGGSIWFFNITRHVDRKGISHLEEDAVFRLNPVGLDILCGPGFKEAVERSGLTGLKFRRVNPDNEFGMV